MFFFLSLVTSVKDYFEIVHKVFESQNQIVTQYNDFGALLTYCLINLKEFFSIFQPGQIFSLPILIPDIASAIISEVSVLDTHFFSPFNFLETSFFKNELTGIINTQNWKSDIVIQDAATSIGTQRDLITYSFEKFLLGFVNSLFIWLPTSVSQLIVLRRFIIQGLEAGYIAGLGTIAGNILWISSIIFGFRFIVIPWLSLDYIRYIIGFVLILKYLWDTYKERRVVRDKYSLNKIFILSFLITFTEQSSLFPFLKTMSITPTSSLLETFPVNTFTEFICIHGAYVLGLLLGCLSLLHFMYWFWEKPALNIYMQYIQLLSSSRLNLKWKEFFRFITSFKFVNFAFLYMTMLFTMASLTYFGLDYTLTSPLGFVHEDKLFGIQNKKLIITEDSKPIRPFSFLYVRASDSNTRIKRGHQTRKENWRRKHNNYLMFDASLYDQAYYDFFSLEDLNYGFDRFWLRRKIRNRIYRYFFFPKFSRKIKKQFIMSSIETEKAARYLLFRTLSDELYHPVFHDFKTKTNKTQISRQRTNSEKIILPIQSNNVSYGDKNNKINNAEFIVNLQKKQHYLFLKFSRNFSTRINKEKSWQNLKLTSKTKSLENFIRNSSTLKNFVKKDQNFFILKTTLKNPSGLSFSQNLDNKKSKLINVSQTRTQLLHPIKYYSEKEKAFQRKLNYYGVNIYRKFTIEKNAPYFRIFMKRLFFYYKPTRRLERTWKLSRLNATRTKESRIPRKLIYKENNISKSNDSTNLKDTFSFIGLKNVEEKKDSISTSESNEKPNNIEKGSILMNVNKNNQNAMTTLLASAEIRRISTLLDNTNNIDTQSGLITKANSSYTIKGKRASRYRSQIYKDVLLHWFYSPFNRLLLKFDIDSFISRQPKTQLLTNKEEKLLHLRRFLLAEHFDTLRWYSYMQQVQTMKTRVGGTKSFASRVYNQQFAGTFKKIRHLFSITPSFSEQNVLKYDQLLFNEIPIDKKLNPYLHEELYPSFFESSLKNVSPVDSLDLGSAARSAARSANLLSTSETQLRRLAPPLAQLTQLTQLTQRQNHYFINSEEKPFQKHFFEKNNCVLNSNKFSDNCNWIWNKISNKELKISTKPKKLRKTLYDKLLLSREGKLASKVFGRVEEPKHIKRRKKFKRYFFKFLLRDTKLLTKKQQIAKIESKSLKNEKSQVNFLTSIKKTFFDNLFKIFRFKYFLKRKKTEDYWKEKMSLLQTKRKTRKKFKIKKQKTQTYTNILKTEQLSEKDNTKKVSFLSLQKINLIPLQTSSAVINSSLNSDSTKNKSRSARRASGAKQMNLEQIGFSHQLNIFRKIQKPRRISNLIKKSQTNFVFKNLQKEPEARRKIIEKATQKLIKETIKKQATIIKSQSDSNSFTKADLLKIQNMDIDGLNLKKQVSLRSQSERSETNDVTVATTSLSDSTNARPLLDSNDFDKAYDFWLQERRNNIQNEGQKRDELETNLVVLPNKKFSTLVPKNERLYKQNLIKKPKIYKKGKYQKQQKNEYLDFPISYDEVFQLNGLNSIKEKILQKSSIEAANDAAAIGKKNFIGPFEKLTNPSEGISKIKKTYVKNVWKKFKNSKKKQISLAYINQMLKTKRRYKKRYITKMKLEKWWNNNKETISSLNQNNNEKIITQDNLLTPLKKTVDLFFSQSILFNQNKIQESDFNEVSKNRLWEIEKQRITEEKKKNLSTLDIIEKDSLSVSSNIEFFGSRNIPYYAGWDESLRKFIVTNRIFSRQQNAEHFFLQGSNINTSLFWKIPFAKYEEEQYYPAGRNAFSPIKWRRIKFRNTLLKNWRKLKNELTNQSSLFLNKNQNKPYLLLGTSKKSKLEIKDNLQMNYNFYTNQLNLKKTAKLAKIRCKQKRFNRRAKFGKPTQTTSGLLLQEVLPLHFIYISLQPSRYGRDRYISPRMRRYTKSPKKTKFQNRFQTKTYSASILNSLKTEDQKKDLLKENSVYGLQEASGIDAEFTLRRRIKTRRKYKKKREKNIIGKYLPRRKKFLGDSSEIERWRPFSRERMTTKLNQKTILNPNKIKRIKGLKKRIPTYIVNSDINFKPYAGGFLWAGDYLKLGQDKNTPNFQKNKKDTQKNDNITENIKKISTNLRKKKRRKRKYSFEIYQLHPKKYLIQRHNIKVLKKKLEKIQKYF